MTAVQPLSRRVLAMEESATLKMSAMARALAAEGHDVISLSLGEPDFDTPEHIKAAAKQALDEGYTKYTPVPGLLELRQAITTKFKRDNDLDYSPDQIVVSNGAKQSIANLALALLDEGDEVIILAPYWVSYDAIVKVAGGKSVIVGAGIEQDYKVSAEQVAAAITPRTKAVLFSSPCNPTGSVYSRAELSAIADVVAPHEQITIISDEIYEYINFGEAHTSIGTIPAVKERTVTVNGFSKGFAMTGWRLGYIGAPQWLAKACAKIQGQFTSGATAFGQKAAVTALLGDMQATHDMRAAYAERRRLFTELLSVNKGMRINQPGGAFYIFPNIEAYLGRKAGDKVLENDVDFCEYILHEAHVAIVPGSAFGAPGCIRLSYAASEAQLREAAARMQRALAKLD